MNDPIIARMVHCLRGLSPNAEFAIVIIGAFGLFTLNSLLDVISLTPRAHITESHLRFVILYELFCFPVLLGFLAIRGWTIKQFGLTIDSKDSATGLGLALLAIVITTAPAIVVAGLFPQVARAANPIDLVSGNLWLGSIVAGSLINPLYEELFVSAYIVSATQERCGLFGAINMSVAIRLVYHLYHGVIGVLFIIPLGLLFAIWYARTGRLWPLVVAHAILDFLALLPYAEL